jgi:uncharacterized membrane protein
MAGPGDPTHSDDHDDDLIGFASPASLQGRARETTPAPKPEPEQKPAPRPAAPMDDLFAERAEPVATPEPEPTPAPTPTPKVVAPAVEPAPVEPEPAPPKPVDAAGVFAPSPESAARLPGRRPAPIPGGGMSQFAVYALILFAVPTLGASALIGLFAVTRRDPPDEPLTRSHFIYQQRTLFAAGVAAVAGLILLAAPFALGVPILFFLALWTVARGASGVWKLKAGQPIAEPRGWWI